MTLGQLCAALMYSQSRPDVIQPGFEPGTVVMSLALRCSALDRCSHSGARPRVCLVLVILCDQCVMLCLLWVFVKGVSRPAGDPWGSHKLQHHHHQSPCRLRPHQYHGVVQMCVCVRAAPEAVFEGIWHAPKNILLSDLDTDKTLWSRYRYDSLI